MKVLVVDDEPPARARASDLLEEIGGVEVVGEAGNGLEALAAIERLEPDVVLLDIRMPGMDGLEVARHLLRLASPPAVVFTTAYDVHALAAFEARAADYLLKPIRRARLAEALARARALTVARVPRPAEPAVRTHLSARVGASVELVPIEAVRYLRAERKYVLAGHPGGELILDESLSELEAELGEAFLRVHRSALVALAHVRGLERIAPGRVVVRMADVDAEIEVSRRLLTRVRDRLQDG